jgi:hypothetical protein
MAICGLLALVLGYFAGLRFRVMVVLPMEFAAGAAAIALVLLGRIGAGEAGLGFLVFSFALQIGYGLALACPVSLRTLVQRRPLKA